MGGDRCQNSRPVFNDWGGGGGGGGGGSVVKCCRLLHKTSTINLYSIPLAIIIPESVSPNLVMAAAARVLPSLRGVFNALVPTQDGRSVLSD